MTPDRAEIIEHLKMVQDVIRRMNANSFLLKRWSLIILAALILYPTKDGSMNAQLPFLVAPLPIITFWLLDSFYLWQERGYVALHNDVRSKNTTNFDMRGMFSNNKYLSVVFSKTIFSFYAFQLLFIGAIYFIK